MGFEQGSHFLKKCDQGSRNPGKIRVEQGRDPDRGEQGRDPGKTMLEDMLKQKSHFIRENTVFMLKYTKKHVFLDPICVLRVKTR